MNSKSYESLRKLSRGRFSTVDFAKLKQLAKTTVGNTEDYLLQEMQIILELYSQLDSKVDETEASIKECVSDMNPPILSVPGIGVDSAAVILAEFGDFIKFNNGWSFNIFDKLSRSNLEFSYWTKYSHSSIRGTTRNTWKCGAYYD